MSHSFVAALGLSILVGLAPLAHAGNLKATLHGSSLTVKGDDAGIDVIFTSAEPNQPQVNGVVSIICEAGSTVNGNASANFTLVKSVSITLGDGANHVVIDQLAIDKTLTVKGGDVASEIDLSESQIGGNVSIKGGTARITFDCEGSELAKNLTVTGKDNPDVVRVDCFVAGKESISLAKGANTVQLGLGSAASLAVRATSPGQNDVHIESLSVDGSAKITIGLGANDITLEDSQIGKSFTFDGGAGGDHVSAELVQFGEDATFKLGKGQNSVALENVQIGDDLTVTAGDGDDTVTKSGTVQIGDRETYHLDGGNNTSP